MNIFKTLCITLGLCLFANVAGAAAVTTYNYGSGPVVPLLVSQTTTIGTAGFCLDLFEDITANVTAEACNVLGSNEVVWPWNAQVTNITIQHIVAGTAADACLFEVEVGTTGVIVLAGAITAVDQADALTTHPYKIDLADGDVVGIVASESTSCAGATEVIVTLWGRWVPAEAF